MKWTKNDEGTVFQHKRGPFEAKVQLKKGAQKGRPWMLSLKVSGKAVDLGDAKYHPTLQAAKVAAWHRSKGHNKVFAEKVKKIRLAIAG